MSILDENRDFIAEHLSAANAQLDAMALYAVATHGIRAFPTFGRMLFTSQREESGKTLAMMLTAHLSSAPMDTSGTAFGLHSALAACGNEPEKPMPTLYLDEVSDIFGKAGNKGTSNPIAEILRKGYKSGAQRSRSVNGAPEYYPIYTPFLMSGLQTAVPRDIRSRCIVIDMKPGRPRKYYSVRDGESYASALRDANRDTVMGRAAELTAFRALGIHPKLTNRKLEVWEPLLAVAYVFGGQKWLNRAVSAFTELSLNESDQPKLTPRQTVMRDVAEIAEAHGGADGFIGGLVLADELRRSDNPLYAGRDSLSLACLVRDTVPFASSQRTVRGERMRGYPVADLVAAWDAVKPAEQDDVELPEQANPFAVSDSADTSGTLET